jgi:hypothetical protein
LIFKLKGQDMIRRTALLAAVAFGFIQPASAHNAWLLPSITVLSDTNQSVTVDAGASTAPFEANHQALGIDMVKVWATRWHDGQGRKSGTWPLSFHV